MNRLKLLQVTKGKGDLNFEFILNKKTSIMDFYNIYCNYVEYNHNKIFSETTVLKCLDSIYNKTKFNDDILIVSKNIFEVRMECLLEKTKKYKNMTYVIVEDNHDMTSKNKERDDFVCILLNYINDRSYIISNDMFKNYSKILKNSKPMTLKMIKLGEITEFKITEKYINEIRDAIVNEKFKPIRSGFNFKKVSR